MAEIINFVVYTQEGVAFCVVTAVVLLSIAAGIIAAHL